MRDASFLPEDYLARLAERRTNLISLTLFVVVMGAVFGAFLVTNRQASQVKAAQAAINTQFKEAASRIEELNELEQQKDKMLTKAELATALVERVPRSILLAELINRMPERLSLQEFEIKSTPVKKEKPKAATEGSGRLSRKRANAAKEKEKAEAEGGPERARTREDAMEEREVEAPQYVVEIIMVGIAPTDLEVSRYMAELNAYPLLRDVTLKYSVQTDVNEQTMREFRVEMKLADGADIRAIDPLAMPRGIKNPMTDDIRFIAQPPAGTDGGAAADDASEEN